MQGSAGPSRGVKFVGSHHHQLDAKGRVSLPAVFRKEAADQRFILVEAYESTLALYPESEWGRVEERVSEMMAAGEEERLDALAILSAAVEVTPDAQGRILIPNSLRKSAGLKESVVLIGAITKIELWSPEAVEAKLTGRKKRIDPFRSRLFR